MCSDAQLWMTEERAHTCEGEAPEFLASASHVDGDDSTEPAPASRPGIGRALGACLDVARAWGQGLIRLLRQGRKDRAKFRKNALSHARRQPAD